MSKNKIDVCLSPALLHLFALKDRISVVIDIFRASSTICTALAHGATKIIPIVATDERENYNENDYLFAAEREGKKVDGFDFGNSPFEYMDGKVKDKVIVFTTTNGTKAITQSMQAAEIVMGSFLNITVLCNWLKSQERDLLLLCSGWKEMLSFEDILFAGAVVSRLKTDFEIESDAALVSKDLYKQHENDLLSAVKNSSHFHRLSKLGVEKDIEYCLMTDQTDVIPIWKEDGLVKL
ncbi:MAG: 2-phosphosulfolactate phosphatase [Bacteroidetes bacterium]|nr:2-phosphosulfolactate phosphatase [Bacteroidota bacterium]